MDIRRARLPPAVGVPPFFAGAAGSASSTPATDSRRARKSALFCPPAGAFAGAFLQCQEEAGAVSSRLEPERSRSDGRGAPGHSLRSLVRSAAAHHTKVREGTADA